MRKNLLVMVAAVIAAVASGGYAQGDLPMPRHYVEDYANVVNDSDEQSLNGILQELEQKTGTQYIVLTVTSTSGTPIEEFGIGLFDKWKLGQQGKDNGMLFILAFADRKWRFEVGYGLEGFITDSYCGQVGRNILVPNMRRQQYSRGIYEANVEVIRKIAVHYGVELTGMPKLSPMRVAQARRGVPCCGIVFLIMLLMMLFSVGRRGGIGMWLLLPFLMGGGGFGGGYGRSGSFGGGRFGGSFGGFGGGMGGRAGGGGASGGW